MLSILLALEVGKTKLTTYLELGKERWIEGSYDADGPFYMTVLALATLSPKSWQTCRLNLLQRLLVAAHVRSCSSLPIGPGAHQSSVDKTPKDWTIYKSIFIFWALIEGIYNKMFKVMKKV